VIKSTFKFVFILSIGIALGWFTHDKYSHTSDSFVTIPNINNNNLDSSEMLDDKKFVTPKVDAPFASTFFNEKMLANKQLGALISMIKDDMLLSDREKLDQDLMHYASSLLTKTPLLEETEVRLKALLGNIETDTHVKQLLAKYYEKVKNYENAILQWMQIRETTSYSDEYENIQQKINTLLQAGIERFKVLKTYEKAVDFFNAIIESDPGNYEIQMQFANYQYEMGKYDEVLSLLEPLSFHTEFQDQANDLKNKTVKQIAIITQHEITIPLIKQGKQFIVKALINNREPVRLMIDTGASLTILTPDVIQNLGIDNEEPESYVSFSTANGVVKGPIRVIDKIGMQSIEVSDLSIGVLPLFANRRVDGLLGMNFLSQFSFFLDQKNQVLVLSPR